MKRLAILAALLVASPAVAKEAASTSEPAKAEAKKPAKKKEAKKDDDDGRLEKTEDTVEGGQHWRIESKAGAIHVWVPKGYDRDNAGTVVYVHGYHTDVDGAWEDHDLAKQFRQSRQNAIFIVPEAPRSREDGVKWPALADLRKAVKRANIRLPAGPVVVIGHSGAFRTMRKWVDHKHVTQMILLDALYGGENEFDDFIGTGKRASEHRMIAIGSDTAAETEEFADKYPFAVVRDKMPDAISGFTKEEKKAKLLYVKSQYGHMEIVTGGKVIPLLLRLTPLKKL